MNRLKEMRVKRGLSQIALFSMTGIHTATISYVERQYLPPSEAQKEKFAAALRIRKSWLFPRSKANSRPSRAAFSSDLQAIQLSASPKK